ncbi:hypothetical protein Tco_0952796 [Tanacetum coccineum]|uniref:Uncharacterized protein n=1 Tax=Tanacetum coccineum TaxID=301880 RepID=A0ABQ5DY20_9ASTR
MSVYLKNMGGYKHNQLKGRSYDEIQKLFDKEMKRVNSFVAMNLEQKTNENEEVEEDNEVELKIHMVIVKDDDIAFDAILLATKSPVIGIDREDLETLWKLVKTKHGDTRPDDEHERVLWGFFQIPIALEDQEKTTFTCPYGTFAYRRMPFGLCNCAGPKFSKMLDQHFSMTCKHDAKPRLIIWVLLLQRFNIKIKDKKEQKTWLLISRLENPNIWELAEEEIEDKFPDETFD